MASCSGRNLIGRRTQSDRAADAIRWHREHFLGALLGGALVSSAPTELHQPSCTNQAAPTKQTGIECPTEHAEHTEPSGREVPPTDRHRCALIRRVWQDAIPTPPITQPNHLWKSVKSVGEYYHAGAAASAAPTKQMGRVSHRTRGTHRTFWQRKPPTDRHRLGGYGIPAIPTLPITQPNILCIPWENILRQKLL